VNIYLILEYTELNKIIKFNVWLQLNIQVSKIRIPLPLNITKFVSAPKTLIRILIKFLLPLKHKTLWSYALFSHLYLPTPFTRPSHFLLRDVNYNNTQNIKKNNISWCNCKFYFRNFCHLFRLQVATVTALLHRKFCNNATLYLRALSKRRRQEVSNSRSL